MRNKISEENQNIAAKLRLRSIVEAETAKFLARGGKIKNGPRLSNDRPPPAFGDFDDLSDILPGSMSIEAQN